MDVPEGAKQLINAAKRLNASFESIRSGVPHAGERGRETQDALLRFLNLHLPKRFHATSGFIIQPPSTVSAHIDVIIYDQQDAYVFSPADGTLMIPNDNVAAVIEVKSTLNKAELSDAAKKISSAKQLNKLPELSTDYPLIGSDIQMTRTRGILFAYSAETTIDTLWNNLRELNSQTDSDHWIDEIAVLGRGCIAYQIQVPVSREPMHYGGKLGSDPLIFPIYIVPVLYDAPDAVLPTFMLRLSHHLSHYRRRPMPNPSLLIPPNARASIRAGYWFDTAGQLHELPPGQVRSDLSTPDRPPERIVFSNHAGEFQGQVEWLPWCDGHVYALRISSLPNPKFVLDTVLLPYKGRVPLGTFEASPGLLMTSLLPGPAPPDFRRTFELLSSDSMPFRAELFDFRGTESAR